MPDATSKVKFVVYVYELLEEKPIFHYFFLAKIVSVIGSYKLNGNPKESAMSLFSLGLYAN